MVSLMIFIELSEFKVVLPMVFKKTELNEVSKALIFLSALTV